MIRFEWDEAKAKANKKKHGVSFEESIHIFEYPYVLSVQDRIEDGEPRWQSIGLVGGVVLLLVAIVFREMKVKRTKSFASSLPDAPTERSEYGMTKIVRKTLSETPLTAKQKSNLAKLAERPDTEIDYSDIPPLTDKFWQNAASSPFYRPVKQQLTVRLDADVLAWLRKQGKGYQTRINSLLRARDAQRRDRKTYALSVAAETIPLSPMIAASTAETESHRESTLLQ